MMFQNMIFFGLGMISGIIALITIAALIVGSRSKNMFEENKGVD